MQNKSEGQILVKSGPREGNEKECLCDSALQLNAIHCIYIVVRNCILYDYRRLKSVPAWSSMQLRCHWDFGRYFLCTCSPLHLMDCDFSPFLSIMLLPLIPPYPPQTQWSMELRSDMILLCPTVPSLWLSLCSPICEAPWALALAWEKWDINLLNK